MAGPGATVRTARSASGAAALDPPQWFRPPHCRLAGRRGEDHPPGRRLQHRRDDDPDGLVHVAPAVLHHDHGAVIQVGDPLVLLFPFLDHLDVHLLTGDDDRLERVGEVVEVEDANPFQLRHPVEVVIIRHDGGGSGLFQLDVRHVDFSDIGHVLVDKFNVDQWLFLQQVEDLEAATSAVAAQRVTGVGDVLQLSQHEMRNKDLFAKKSSLGDVHDATVDDDARVEEYTRLYRAALDQTGPRAGGAEQDRKSTRLNSSHLVISYAV